MTATAIRAAAANFTSCLDRLWPLAARRGISRNIYAAYTAELTPDLRIMDLLDGQPEFTKSFWDYLDLLVNDTRIEQGRIIEGHGDLRPEHIFLGEPAAIIDCLEFDRALRLLDPLEELAFLSMECDRLGAAKWGQLFIDVYHRHVGDDAAEELMCFYGASRACLRSRLAVGHLHDGEIREPRRWLDQADRYLELANRYVARL